MVNSRILNIIKLAFSNLHDYFGLIKVLYQCLETIIVQKENIDYNSFSISILFTYIYYIYYISVCICIPINVDKLLYVCVHYHSFSIMRFI